MTDTTANLSRLNPQSVLLANSSRFHASPFLKWAGGKGHLLSRLLTRVPSNVASYYEPFLGGGALFFALANRRTNLRAFLSDTNPDLIRAYNVVKDEPKELIDYLRWYDHLYHESNDKSEFYYTIRQWKPTSRVESAARFVFLNKTCYNGLYRVNKNGEFNVPFGRNKRPKIFDESNILAGSSILRQTNASIRALDYRQATENCREGDLVYLDPPYDPTSKTSAFTDYTSSGFTKEDQEALAEYFVALAKKGCTVLLSNSDTGMVRRLYRGFRMKSFSVARPISCIGKRRNGFRELIVFTQQGTVHRTHPSID
jgi:DNA adenine methylase